MTTRPNGPPTPDTDRLLADFLTAEAPPYEPPLLLPAVLARTALTRRRPAWRIPSRWLPAGMAWRPRTHRRSSTMFSVTGLAALGTVLAVAGGSLFVAGTLSPSPGAPSPSPSPITLPAGVELEAGTTYAIDSADAGRMILTVPGTGWFTIDTWFLGKDVAGLSEPGGSRYDIRVIPYLVSNLHADPCAWIGSVLEPAVGPTVDDLATALMEQPLQNASSVSDVTLGGHAGKKVEMSVPDDFAGETCDGGNYGRWYDDDDPANYGPWTFGAGQHDTVYIIDVEGTRWVIDTQHRPGVPESDIAELDRLVASIRFEPPVSPEASSSPSP